MPRPPYPAQSGLWGHPTLINNVETFGNIVPIIEHGAEWYAGIGTAKSKGTKIFALAGKVENTGLIEVPMGITLREIVFDIGGGIPDGREFKAAQTGGPSGGCIPAAVPGHHGRLREPEGAGLDHGIGRPDRDGRPELHAWTWPSSSWNSAWTKAAASVCPAASARCRCTASCRRITDGSATRHDLETLEELCTMVRETSLCGLGQSAPNPVLSTLKYFRNEYEDHIDRRTCEAGVCEMTEVPVLELIEELPRRIRAAYSV